MEHNHLQSGDIINERYVLEKRLGAGGYGSVYLAFDKQTQRKVAIKTIIISKAEDDEAIKRFEREAIITAGLRSKFSVSVYDHGKDERTGSLFLVMEHIDGQTLNDRFRVPFSPKNCVSFLQQVLASLIEAHEVGLIHRDLKPTNIMITRGPHHADDELGDVTVLDYGIATYVQKPAGMSTITQEGIFLGTFQYAAPEQMLSKAVPASDLYSLGLIALQGLTGKTHYEPTHTQEQIIAMAFTPEPWPVPDDLPGPPMLGDILRRMIEKKVSKRYQFGKEILEDLKQIQFGPISDSSLVIQPASEAPTDNVSQEVIEDAIDTQVYVDPIEHLETQQRPDLSTMQMSEAAKNILYEDKKTGVSLPAVTDEQIQNTPRPINRSVPHDPPTTPRPTPRPTPERQTSKELAVVAPDDTRVQKSSKRPVIMGVVVVLIAVGVLGAVLSSKDDKVAPKAPVVAVKPIQKTKPIDTSPGEDDKAKVASQGKLLAQSLALSARSIVLGVKENTPSKPKTKTRKKPKKDVAKATQPKETPKTETPKVEKKVKPPKKKKPVVEDDDGGATHLVE